MRYFVYFCANGNTYNVKPYVYTNKRKAIRAAHSIVQGEHFYQITNSSYYSVINEEGYYVAKGWLKGLGHWVCSDDVGYYIGHEDFDDSIKPYL